MTQFSFRAQRSLASISKRIYLSAIILLLPGICFFLSANMGLAGVSYAQNVAINNSGASANASAMLDVSAANKGILLPRVSLTGTGDVTTISSPAVSLLVYNTATAGTAPANVVPGYYFWNGTAWSSFAVPNTSIIPFSSGVVLNGASVVSSAPVLIGFGSSKTQTINGSGQSVLPSEMGGFSFTVPYNGIIKDMVVNTDLLVASEAAINTIGLRYDFTVFVAHSPGNSGSDYETLPYLTTPLTTTVTFGFPYTNVTAGTFRSATAFKNGSLIVTAGDRIGIRVRTWASTNPSASDITQLSFSASLRYLTTE